MMRFDDVTVITQNINCSNAYDSSSSSSLSLAGSSGRHTWVKHSSRKSSATHSYECVQYFPVSRQGYGCQRFGIFNVYTDVDACDCTRGLYGHPKKVCSGS